MQVKASNKGLYFFYGQLTEIILESLSNATLIWSSAWQIIAEISI